MANSAIYIENEWLPGIEKDDFIGTYTLAALKPLNILVQSHDWVLRYWWIFADRVTELQSDNTKLTTKRTGRMIYFVLNYSSINTLNISVILFNI